MGQLDGRKIYRISAPLEMEVIQSPASLQEVFIMIMLHCYKYLSVVVRGVKIISYLHSIEQPKRINARSKWRLFYQVQANKLLIDLINMNEEMHCNTLCTSTLVLHRFF